MSNAFDAMVVANPIQTSENTMISTISSIERASNKNSISGMAALVRHIYEGRDIAPIWDILLGYANANPHDCAAFMDLSIILQATGQVETAKIAQQAALEISRKFTITHGTGTGLRVLAFVTAGDFMANTPIDFLLEKSNCTLLLHYVDADTSNLQDVPEHDVAFLAVGESNENAPVLDNLERLLSKWPGPILNNAPRAIKALTRSNVALYVSDEPTICSPMTIIVDREDLLLRTYGAATPWLLLANHVGPIIIRPVGTHAGKGMSKIDELSNLDAYLSSHIHSHYYICPFIEYRSADGYFRKQRIAFINGVAFACHLAISDNWMVHYLSAGMEQDEWRRVDEEKWMRGFESDFVVRHAKAFKILCQKLGLDYFAIDCAELADGRLLLFEADVAMIVHSLDPDTKFPYKKPPMNRLFAAFETALVECAKAHD